MKIRRIAIACAAGAALALLGRAPAFAGAGKSRAHSAPPKVAIDTVRAANGTLWYRVRYTDIVVRLRAGGWLPQDSTLFFTERRKVEWASKILLDQIDFEKDSLRVYMDSAGARVARGALTQAQVDSTVATINNDLGQKITTQNYALRRLEDYRRVLDTANGILKRTTAE